MEIYEEIRRYCSIKNPAGAFMISGEWGCGKTYLVENELPQKLEDCILIRISMFGMESVDDIQKEIKMKWIYAWSEYKVNLEDKKGEKKKIGKNLEKILNVIKDAVPGDIGNCLNAFLEIIPIQNTIEDKTVVLVFDDLERSRISQMDLLGCINNYCENQRFHTIIIANEDKLTSGLDNDSGKLSYDDIKEKIVQRNFNYIPDYMQVVCNLVNDISEECTCYKDFLKNNISLLTVILAGEVDDDPVIKEIEKKRPFKEQNDVKKELEETKTLLQKRPHNIRSINYAIQDFQRVYDKLVEYDVKTLDKWLGTFVTFVMAYRANLLSDNDYCGRSLCDSNLKQLYFGIYDPNYKSDNIFTWVKMGVWDDEAISTDIEFVIEKSKAKSPKDIVRMYRLVDMEDSDFKEGFPLVSQMAYEGKLSLDEYVNYIQNCATARYYDVPLEDICWDDIKKGIKIQLNTILDKREKPSIYQLTISEENKNYYTKGEWEAYKLIEDFRDQSQQMFSNNEKLYIELLKNDISRAFVETVNKEYYSFSEDMMEITVEAFDDANNQIKLEFSEYFTNVWNRYFSKAGMNINDLSTTLQMFIKLKEKLEVLNQKYKNSGMNIAAIHARKFIKVVTKLIEAAKSIEGETEE